jgi:hypothetical protein
MHLCASSNFYGRKITSVKSTELFVFVIEMQVKRRERAADHSPRTSNDVKKTWIYNSTPHKVV